MSSSFVFVDILLLLQSSFSWTSTPVPCFEHILLSSYHMKFMVRDGFIRNQATNQKLQVSYSFLLIFSSFNWWKLHPWSWLEPPSQWRKHGAMVVSHIYRLLTWGSCSTGYGVAFNVVLCCVRKVASHALRISRSWEWSTRAIVRVAHMGAWFDTTASFVRSL